jgi:glycosyltransferase involved in cell wall biosynthesis
VISAAAHVFADGMQLARDVEELSGRSCEFLASSRLLPVVPNPETGDSARLGSRFMFVGRYHKNKGPDVLLDAISRIPEEDRKSIHVDMYGFGPLKDQLQEFVRNNDLQRVVSIHGTIDALQLARELARTEFLIIPSRIESIPVILSDAVQVGVPLIVSDVGDLGEVVRSAEAGIVVAPEDPSELAAAILDASRLGPVQYHSGVQRLSSMFNIGSVCDRWLNREAIRS